MVNEEMVCAGTTPTGSWRKRCAGGREEEKETKEKDEERGRGGEMDEVRRRKRGAPLWLKTSFVMTELVVRNPTQSWSSGT